MNSFGKIVGAVILAQFLIFVFVVAGVAVIGVAYKSSKAPTVDNGAYLVVDIYGDVMEYMPPQSFPESIISGKPETLTRILGNLEKAAADDRIAGVIMKVSSNNGLGGAMIQEIRGAIDEVQAAGKKVYAYSDALDRNTLSLASTCDEVIMPETGYFTFTGIGMNATYLRGAFDKLGIKQQIHQIADYKSAAELTLRKDMSPEAREMYGWIMDDVWDMQIGAIASDRGMTEEQIVACMEKAAFTAPEAKEAGLIDELLYWHQFEERLKDEDDDDELKTVSQSTYAKISREDAGLPVGDKKIAVIHAHGFIGGRKSRIDPMLGPMMGHETVNADLRRARRDDNVAAVVFRVDSGGGESLTSDLISAEIDALAKVKPVIVSMVDVAASGGYMISYKATKVVADPLTITGSIGSISGKMVVRDTYGKIGITFDDVSKGPNAFMWSPTHEFSDDQWEKFVENHWADFNRWLADVADRRGMTFEEAQKLAHGRVWTGRQAKDNGLVDEVGGLETAVALAKEEAGIDADEAVKIVHWPVEKSTLELITGGDFAMAAARWMAYRLVHEDVAETLRLISSGQVGAMPAGITR